MVFSSLTFLCIFLPVVFLLYTVIPSLYVRNALLIIASLLFYAYGEPVYVLLMIFSSLLNWLCALWVRAGKSGKNRRAVAFAVLVNLGILIIFKYTGLIVTTINAVLGLAIPVPQIELPIGISFFTFQALSYVIDVYRSEVDPQKNYFYVLLYISFFPQLIAGPIVKYHDIAKMITERRQDSVQIARGLRRFIGGLAKKVLIANTLGMTADAVFSTSAADINMPLAWLGAIAYIFQIYYDFSGYSDMAIGLGLMFGFRFKENFQYPYGARSIKEFWHRWHISLSSWLKDYLYIPLGGNRKGRPRAVFNRLVVFICCGLWHGANWTFVVWGLWHGVFLLIEEYVPAIHRLPRFIGHIYTMLVVTIGFVMFRADTIQYGLAYICDMFLAFDLSSASMSLFMSQLTPWFVFILAIAVIGCAPIKPLAERIRQNALTQPDLKPVWKVVQYGLYIVAFIGLIWCILRLAPSGYNPFIYFRF